MLQCPSCGNSNPDASVACEQCGEDVCFQTIVDATSANSSKYKPELSGPRKQDTGPLNPGEVICDRYEVLALIGRGGMGCVYKVMDRHVGRVIALKTIRQDSSTNAAAVKRFKDEMLLARGITHKNVIRIFDFGVDGDLRFITMEYCEGEDLHARIERCGRLSVPEAIPIMQQICAALVSAHSEGVIHRDLKPQNILINDRDEIRILDFGLARLTEGEAALTGVLAGTPDYMSPEQALGEPLDARSDLFSAGLVFYEMLTGVLPFQGGTAMSRLIARTQGRVRSVTQERSDIPLAVSAVITRCLEREKKRRYASAQEILNDLQQIATQVEKGQRKVRPAFWNARTLIYAAAFLAVTVSVVAFLRLRHSGAAPPEARYLAVLPFAPEGDITAAKSAAEGVRESVSSLLSAMRSIHSVAPGAVDSANLTKSAEDIAKQVGANLILQGQVHQESNELRIALVLYDVWKHAQIGSVDVSGPRSDLLSLEDQVGSAVLAALQLSPAPAEATSPPTHNMEAYDLYLQGRDALKNRRDDPEEAARALSYFEQAVSKDQSFALAWSGVADASVNLYRLRHDTVDAQRATDAARRAAQGSNLPEVHLAAGSVFTQTGKPDEAVAEIRRALSLAPNSDDAYVRLGRAYLEVGKTSDALNALKSAAHMNPYYWYNHEQLARALFRVGRDEEALSEFRKYSELAPESPKAHLGIAGVLVRQGQWEKSIPEYEKSLALKPTTAGYTSLGTVLFYLGRYAEALPRFEKAAQMDGRNPLALGNLGSAYRQLGQRDKADAAFSRAIAEGYRRLELNPQDAMMLGFEALFHAYKGQSEDATSLIARAREIDPASNELMYDEAVIDALASPIRTKEAITALQQAIHNGYSVDEARRDPDLKILDQDAAFRAVLASARN